MTRPADSPAYDTPPAYRPKVGILWWLRRRSYTFFVLRELSAVFVAWSVVFLLLFARALEQGEPEYRAFLDWAATPWVVVVNIVTVAFLVLHAVTWFNLTPAAMVVWLRDRRVPAPLVAGGAYAAWIVVSALIVWLVVTR